eukprot:11506938-Heterocapsa_arctica.AAC.1
MENHKDKTLQQNEEKDATRLRKGRKLNHTKDEEELDQLHEYVHAGILHQMGLKDKHLIVFGNEHKHDGEDQQHMAGEEHETEDTKDVQSTQEQHKMDEGDITVPRISGEQKDEDETKTTD